MRGTSTLLVNYQIENQPVHLRCNFVVEILKSIAIEKSSIQRLGRTTPGLPWTCVSRTLTGGWNGCRKWVVKNIRIKMNTKKISQAVRRAVRECNQIEKTRSARPTARGCIAFWRLMDLTVVCHRHQPSWGDTFTRLHCLPSSIDRLR